MPETILVINSGSSSLKLGLYQPFAGDMQLLFEALAQSTQWPREISAPAPTAVGHRVVHGGPRLTSHQRITPELLVELKSVVHFAPLHIPLALELIAAAERTYPSLPQFACFDTAFHTTIHEVASRFPLPLA